MRFDRCAPFYDEHATPQYAFAKRVAGFTNIRPGDMVVELGAGTGALTQLICAGGTRVLASDASPAMVEIGRKTVPTAEWRLLDAFAGDVPPSDLQISSGLLQWARDPHRALKRWRDALKPGGRMVHAFPCEPCLAEWRELVPESPVMWRSAAEWLVLFQSANLAVQRHQLWIDFHSFTSARAMLHSMHMSGVTGAARLNAGQLRRKMREYDALNRSGAGVTATWAWAAVEATAA